MEKWKAHIALFLVAVIYGANYTIAKDVLDKGYLGPLGFILLRVLAATALFWIFHRGFIREKLRKKDFVLVAFCGLFGVATNQMFFFSGLKLTTPINASLIMTTTPILVLIISVAIMAEKFTWLKLAGVLSGMSGAILLISKGKTVEFSQDQVLGDLMILTNAISYGIYLILVKRLMVDYNPLTIIKWVFTFGFIYVLPFGAPQFFSAEWKTFPPEIWLAIVYVLLFTTFFAYLLNAYALKTVSATVVSAYIYLQPIIASSIALAFAKDKLDIIKITSAILILSGVYMVSKREKKLIQRKI